MESMTRLWANSVSLFGKGIVEIANSVLSYEITEYSVPDLESTPIWEKEDR